MDTIGQLGLSVNAFSTKDISAVPPGHLFLMSEAGSALLCLRAVDDPGDQSTPAIVFRESNDPEYLAFKGKFNCLDIGVAHVRVNDLLASVTRRDVAEVPGNLAVEGDSVCIVARSGGHHSWLIDIATGQPNHLFGTRWYVTAWELGVVQPNGEFYRLHARQDTGRS